MAVRSAKPGEDAFFVLEVVAGDPETCDYCCTEFTTGYENSCVTVCVECASRRKLPVVQIIKRVENTAS